MPAVVKKVTSWSWSRYGSYTQCPLKFKFQNIDKIPIVKGPALLRGAEIHDEAEKYLKGAGSRVPASLAKFADEFKMLRALAKKKPHLISVEDTWAYRSDWTPTTWDDWKGCWVRIKLDVAHIIDEGGKPVVIVTDFKTGKFRPEDSDDYLMQLELYALGALLKWPQLIPAGLMVRPRLVYLDHAKIFTGHTHTQQEFTGKDLKPLQKTWEKRVKPMMNDTKFAPKPNRWCGYCEFGVSKGGTCKFG